LGFILSPFLMFLYAIANSHLQWTKNIIWFFVVFYGATFVISDPGMDAFFYAQQLKKMYETNLSYSELIRYDYNLAGSNYDIIQPTLTYLVSRFTDNYSVLYAVFGLVFGFFYSRNISIILERTKDVQHGVLIVPVILLVLIIPFWSLNGVRMWTAAHIFIYGVINFFYKKNWRYVLFIVLAVFMHFSFTFLLFVFFLYVFLGNRINLFFLFFIFSLAISQIDLNVFNDLITANLPAGLQKKASSYTSKEYIMVQTANLMKTNWYVQYYNSLLKWTLCSILVFIYVKRKSLLQEDSFLKKIFCYTLLQFGFSNFTSSIPSFERFVIISEFLSISVLILLLSKDVIINGLTRLTKLSTPFFIIYILVTIRIGFDTVAVFTIFGNPITAIIVNGDSALISLLR